MLDSGATVNVLPYDLGVQSGAVWEQQTVQVAHDFGAELEYPALLLVLLDDLHPLPGKATWRKLALDGMSPNTEIWGLNSFINTPGTLLAGTHGGGGKFLVLTPPVWAGVKPTVSG